MPHMCGMDVELSTQQCSRSSGWLSWRIAAGKGAEVVDGLVGGGPSVAYAFEVRPYGGDEDAHAAGGRITSSPLNHRDHSPLAGLQRSGRTAEMCVQVWMNHSSGSP